MLDPPLQKVCLSAVQTMVQNVRESYGVVADKKNMPGLITILYTKNSNEECFIGFEAHVHDVLSVL